MKTIQTEKPKKRGLSFILRLLLTVAVCGYALYRCAISAYAVDVTLTPQQTLALLGTEIEGNYYNASTGLSFSSTAVFVGSTDSADLWLWNERDSVIPNTLIPFYSTASLASPYIYSSALIYRVWFPVGMVSSNSDLLYNWYCDFPFDLSGLTRFEMPIFYTISSTSFNSRTNAQLNTSLGLQTFNRLSGSSQMYLYSGVKNNQSVANFGCLPVNFTSDTDFSVSNLFLGLNACKSISQDYIEDVSGTTGEYLYILVECPVISNYSPATTTRSQPTIPPLTLYTTRSNRYDRSATTPANTLDLSQIEENQRLQIEIENDNRNFNAGTFDGVNIIIEKLDNIYALMQARGEIAVDLFDGLQWSPGSDINNYISNGLTHTTARLPDTFNPDTINSLSDLLMNRSQFGRFAAIGIFSIGFGIFCWFVFRGRGGV